MVKNKKGGNKAKRKKNKNPEEFSKQLLLKEDSQFYGKVTNILGNCRFEIIDSTNKTYLGILRGNMKKKVWIHKDNIVLCSTREYEDDKVDIFHKYTDGEVHQLVKSKEIECKFTISDINESETQIDDDIICFEDI